MAGFDVMVDKSSLHEIHQPLNVMSLIIVNMRNALDQFEAGDLRDYMLGKLDGLECQIDRAIKVIRKE